MIDPHGQKLLILDFGSQYTQLIARRVRETGVYCEIHPFDMAADAIRAYAPRGVILSGGPESVTLAQTPRAPQTVFELGVPVLGICYGQQTMAAQLGGKVESSTKREFGYAKVRMHGHSRLFHDVRDEINDHGHEFLHVWMSHGDKVTQLPPGFKIIAESPHAPFAGIADEERRFYGIQFHPEVTHTTQGSWILRRFIYDICGCESLWNAGSIIDNMIASVRAHRGWAGRREERSLPT